MNEKVGYLNLFFREDKDLGPSSIPELIADHYPSLIFIYNTGNRKIEFANQKLIEYSGRDFSNLPSSPQDLDALFHPADLAGFEKLLTSLDSFTRKQSLHFTARLYGKRRNYRLYRLQGDLLNYNGVPLILFIATDITEEVKSKEEIQTTRELLDETEELLQFGSWAWEISTNIVTWTPGLYTLLDYQRADVEGKIGLDFYLDHVLEEYSQAFRDTILNALREKTDFSFEYVLKTNAGTLKNISAKGKLVRDDNGEILKMLCINRDITALRSFEKEQERNIRELNRSNRDLEEFAYIASHDLQEPLRKISMFTERLKAKYDATLDKEGQLFIDRILASAANMRMLIDNLLDFSRANRRSGTFD